MIIIRRVRPKQANFGLVNAIKEPFRMYGRRIARKMGEGISQRADDFAKNSHLLDGTTRAKVAAKLNRDAEAYRWFANNPGKVGAVNAGAIAVGLAAGVGTALKVNSFTRRRRTKNGKIVVEQVDRK